MTRGGEGGLLVKCPCPRLLYTAVRKHFLQCSIHLLPNVKQELETAVDEWQNGKRKPASKKCRSASSGSKYTREKYNQFNTLCNDSLFKSMSDIICRLFTILIHRGHMRHLILQYRLLPNQQGWWWCSVTVGYCSDLPCAQIWARPSYRKGDKDPCHMKA